jgi:hypothetical protein
MKLIKLPPYSGKEDLETPSSLHRAPRRQITIVGLFISAFEREMELLRQGRSGSQFVLDLLGFLFYRLDIFSLLIATFPSRSLALFTSVMACGALLELVSLATFFFDALAICFFLG